MFGPLALLSMILPFALLPLLLALIWTLRARRLRAALTFLAMVLFALTQSRETLYAVGLPLPDPDQPAGGVRAIVGALEWYVWQTLALTTLAASVLIVPMPKPLTARLLASVTVPGLMVATFLAWSFTGLDLR